MIAGRCDGCAGMGAAASEALLTVAVCVFLTTECLNAGYVEALDKAFEKNRFDVLVGNELGKRGQRYRFVVVVANSQSCRLWRAWAPLGVNTRGVPFIKGYTCY